MKNKMFVVIAVASVSTACSMMKRLGSHPKMLKQVCNTTTKVPKRMLFDSPKPFLIIKQQERALVERFGEFNRILEPGLRFKIPFVENLRSTGHGSTRIDMRERVEEMPKQFVITKDNVSMGINALIYYEIQNAEKSVYGIKNLPDAINKLGQTTLRNLVGGLHLDETLTSRNDINSRLRQELGEAATKWGVKVTRVELQEVNPPEDVRLAMEREMTAERNRRAIILDAEGKKRSAVLQSEGVKASEILNAEGKAVARIKLAKAEAESLALIQSAMNEGQDSSRYSMSMKYMDVLPKMTKGGSGKTIVVPYEAQTLAGMTSMIREFLDNKDDR